MNEREMSENVVTENTTAAEDGNENKNKLNADYMSRADVMAIVNEFAGYFAVANSALNKVQFGSNFSEANDALKKLMVVVTGGAHLDFASKNKWIDVPAQKSAYLTSGAGVGIADKQFICDFYQVVKSTASFRADFMKLMDIMVSSVTYLMYSAIRYESQMTEIVTGNDLARIDFAFREFDEIYRTCNDASVFDKVPLSKSRYSAEENVEMMLDFLDEEIVKRTYLCSFLLNSRKSAPEGMNYLHVIDRQTKEFSKFGGKRANLQMVIDKCIELDTMLSASYELATDGLSAYLDGYRLVLENIVVTAQKTMDIIEIFTKEKSKAPYGIMEYDTNVKACVAKYTMGSLTDPLTEGTNYCEIAKTMVSRIQQLARNIAKMAPM